MLADLSQASSHMLQTQSGTSDLHTVLMRTRSARSDHSERARQGPCIEVPGWGTILGKSENDCGSAVQPRKHETATRVPNLKVGQAFGQPKKGSIDLLCREWESSMLRTFLDGGQIQCKCMVAREAPAIVHSRSMTQRRHVRQDDHIHNANTGSRLLSMQISGQCNGSCQLVLPISHGIMQENAQTVPFCLLTF